MSNATCFTQHAPFEGPPLIQNGELKFQAHHVGWIIAFSFTLVATIASFWLIAKHLRWYTNKRQQRYIVRLLFMVPIYATISLASYIFWNHAIPITLARDSYEALVLYSFFYLLLQYLSPTTEGQKEVFRHVVLKKWVFPLGFVKYRPEDGLYFLQLMKWGVLQYCVIRPTTTLAAVILDTIGLYCEDSWGPGWGHIYITVVVSISVTIAMYCLIQLYMPISEKLAPHKPLLKLFSVKAVVFLTFWQATGLSVLTIFGVVKDTNYMTAEDINTGIAAILETFEMMCFAFLHVHAFSYHPYREGKKLSDRTPRFRSLLHAFDFRDMWREIRDGSIYMGRTIRGVDAEEEVRKRIHFARVMGRERELSGTKEPKHVWVIEDVREEDALLHNHGRGRRQDRRDVWLSDPGNHFGGGFEDEVEKELRQRELDHGYRYLDLDPDESNQGHTRGQGSWWRRVFQGRPDRADEDRLSPVPRRPSHIHRSRRRHQRRPQFPSLDSPPPPASVLYEYAPSGEGRSSVRLSHSHQRTSNAWDAQEDEDARPGHHYALQHPLNDHRLPHGTHGDESPSIQARTKPIAAPRPMSASQLGNIELFASRDERPPFATESPLGHSRDRLPVPSGVLRSDSLLARVFPNSTPNTVDGHAPSDGRTNPASSQDTLSTGVMFPPAMSSSSVNLMSPIRGRRAEPFATPMLSSLNGLRSSAHMTTLPSLSPPDSRDGNPLPVLPAPFPRRGHPRPDIVLPTPLSPARYPVDSTRHGYSPLSQSAGNPSPRTVRPSPPLTQPLSPTQANRGHESPRPRFSNTQDSTRRHSAQVERPLARHQRATKRKSVPIGSGDAPRDALSPPASRQGGTPDFPPPSMLQGGDNGMSPTWRTTFDTSRIPGTPLGSGPGPHLTTTPSVSPPSRTLRHARDDIGKARRPWS